MTILANLKNTHRREQKRKRLGRGIGSNWGKTAGRGQKGAKSRAGYKRRHGNEGGQLPIYRKLPYRGFSNVRFQKEYLTINFARLSNEFNEGDVVNRESLIAKGILPRKSKALIKVLGNGKLSKKLVFHVNAISKKAEEELKKLSCEYTLA